VVLKLECGSNQDVLVPAEKPSEAAQSPLRSRRHTVSHGSSSSALSIHEDYCEPGAKSKCLDLP